MHISKVFYTLLILLISSFSLQAQKQAESIPASADAVQPLQEGSKIPAISLSTAEGNTFDLNVLVKEQPTVLIFYRGGWCPYCNVHLQELMEADPQLGAMGYQIVAVSPDAPEKLAESQDKHEMTYRLLSDRNMDAAKAFGVAYQVSEGTVKRYQKKGIKLVKGPAEDQYLLPVPAVFIIDQEGTIRYVYYNADYKTRLNTEVLLQEAKNAL